MATISFHAAVGARDAVRGWPNAPHKMYQKAQAFPQFRKGQSHSHPPNVTYLMNPVFTAVSPPSTVNTAPVINEASSEARKRTALATSSGLPSLRIG